MAPLELILEGKKHDLNSLKEKVLNFGQNYVLYDLARYTAPQWIMDNNHFHGFMEPIIRLEKDQSLNNEEKSFIENVSKLYEFIGSFNKEQYASFDKKEKEDYLRHKGLELVSLLKPFGGNPERYYKISNLLPMSIDENGNMIPYSVYSFEKRNPNDPKGGKRF